MAARIAQNSRRDLHGTGNACGNTGQTRVLCSYMDAPRTGDGGKGGLRQHGAFGALPATRSKYDVRHNDDTGQMAHKPAARSG